MKNYNQKDGMLMIFRAMIMTAIILIICFACYKIYKAKVNVEAPESSEMQRDLADVTFCISSNGNIYKIK